MDLLCTRPNCRQPNNQFLDLDDALTCQTVEQKYCASCRMPLILAGRYCPIRLLGEGGLGRAFLARDRHTPAMRWCVVKQFCPADTLEPDELELAQSLFQREAIALEQLGHRHPQIPELLAYFPLLVPNHHASGTDSFFYLVQAYIEGQNLDAEISERGPLSEIEVTQVLMTMLEILHVVHSEGSIHRDIKPSNIMRDHQGKLYLLDFGAVKLVTTNTETKTSTGIYSMGFAPPEQIEGAKIVPSTDLYALAATCLFLLTGQDPKHLYDQYQHCWHWRSQVPHVSDRLANILDRMLAIRPQERYASAEAALAALAAPPTELDSEPKSAGESRVASPTSPATGPLAAAVPQTPAPSATMAEGLPRQIAPNKTRRRHAPFSLAEMLSSAAFTGFESTLLLMGLSSLFSLSGISLGLWGATTGGLMWLQYRRIIEKIDLVIVAGMSAGLLWLIPALHQRFPPQQALMIALFASAGAIAITSFFRLLYQLLCRFF